MVPTQLNTTAEASALAKRIAAAASRAALPVDVRAHILLTAAAEIERRAEEFSRSITAEVLKPITDARVETQRAVSTLRLAAEEAKRLNGKFLPLTIDEPSRGRWALVRRVPRGPALFVTPFNFPLNLVVHKVAPAIAVGLPFILKPHPRAAGTARLLLETLIAAGWPSEACALALGEIPAIEALVGDEQLSILSFTGSSSVGWRLKTLSGKKHCVLELGGNAGVFVAADADLPWAAARCAWGAYNYSGQVCISVQRIFVEKSVHAAFRKLLVQNIKELKVGPPDLVETNVGPMIDEASAARVEALIQGAVTQGANLWMGSSRQGAVLAPALLENVAADSEIMREEAFGPVAILESVDSREVALERLNHTRFGLQVGLFTNDLAFVQRAFETLDCGGLIVNDVPTWRSDVMPYGGVKDSGLGREGVKSAIEEYTVRRTLVLKS